MEAISHDFQKDGQSNIVSNKIQILRGLAIIAVVFIHNTPIGISQVIYRPILNFCVGLFLFLSGMMSNAEKWNPKKRIIKVLIPYAIWSLIYVVLSTYKTPSLIPVTFIEKLILGNASGVLYYIFVYCEFTLLIPMIDKLAKSKYRYLGFAVAPLEIIVMRLIPLLMGFKLNMYIETFKSISCLPWFSYFYLGYMMGNNIIKIKCSKNSLLILWAISILVQMGEGYGYLCLGEMNCGTQGKLSCIISGGLFSMMAYRFIYSSRECRNLVLKKLGDLSFGIYISHMAVMDVLSRIPFYEQLTPYPINAIIAISVTALFVYLGKRILGKYAKYFAF